MLKKDFINICGNDISGYQDIKVNPENELYEKIAEFHDDALFAISELTELKKALSELDQSNKLEKIASARLPETALEFTGRQFKNLFIVGKKYPKTMLVSGAIAGTNLTNKLKEQRKAIDSAFSAGYNQRTHKRIF